VRPAGLGKKLMALYHLTAKTVSRGVSASAAARSDYIERSGRYSGDEDEVLHKDHGNMPAWAENCPLNYWEAADIYERANGRLFKQIEFALPKELSPQQQIELAASFCMGLAQTKDGLLPYSFAVHKGYDKANPHCHLLISERVNDGHDRVPDLWFKRAAKDPLLGGAKKTTVLHPREWLLQCRELWAERANHALQLAGHEARIDHRTLKAQGIDRAPTTHLGPSVTAMERQGIRTQRGDRNRHREDYVLESIKAIWGKKIDAMRAEKLPRRERYARVKLIRTQEAEELAKARQILSPSPKATEPAPVPVLAPTTDECREILLAIAKREIITVEKPWHSKIKPESYYLEQLKPYMEFIAEAEDKAAAFAFCQERMQADITTEAPRLKEMRREIDKKLRRTGGTGTMQNDTRQEALDYIRIASDREEAFVEAVKGIDMALELSRSRGLGR